MPTPRVSFVLPVYNAGPYLAAAVESLLGQTFGDFEILAINDGSTDGSREVLSRYNDCRLRVLDQTNVGLVQTLNRGIREARGEWIARMDADDVSLPDRLAKQTAYLRTHSQVALLGAWVATIDEQSQPLSDVVPFPVTHEELWSSIGRRPWVMCHPAVMFRRDAAIEVGLYDPAFRHAEDTEFFARLMSRFRAATLPDVVLQYRLRREAVSGVFKDHGYANAQLVRRIMERWQPGEPFAATAQERAEADARIAVSSRRRSARQAMGAYFCRVGRECLRGSRWSGAAIAYLKAAAYEPMNLDGYRGLVAAALRMGSAVVPAGVSPAFGAAAAASAGTPFAVAGDAAAATPFSQSSPPTRSRPAA
ncbi:glycosyltransferase family 2 protein [Humisphaera borealis]|uniref:Glycosyltransferase n=1 Tax=Humisphaera borealis TaxID=2807512 RepID=A0A7M2WWD7_9BACT|nr:glycosyltransferase [Humisphaera borealis]QOV88820.1 glycosyltransferase [Humisphaera borealis]